MAELHSDVVDGIPTFWVDTGRPTLAATLMFRHGQSDEELATSGWTHVLEHLCLHGRGGGPLAVNGAVGLLTTELTAHGPVDLVTEHLRSVCDWLAEPDLKALDHERGILAAESSVRGQGASQEALAWRYGARGPGLCAYQEPGLARATPDALRTLAARSFGRSNAVLMLDGPPPASLTLPLADGEPRPFPTAVPCDDRRPAAYTSAAGVVLSGQVTRSTPATFLTRWLDLELRETLRHRAGAAYAPWSHYEPVDETTAVVLGGSDLAAEAVGGVAATILDLVDRLERGCEPDVLATLVAEFVQGVTDPYQAYAVALRAGHFALRGDEPETLDQAVGSARAVTTDELATHARELADSLMVGLPPAAEPSSRLRPIERSTAVVREGARRYRSANAPTDRSVLAIGSHAVEIRHGPESLGIYLDHVVGLLQVPDGGRRLVAADGWSITIEPTLWRRGSQAVAQLDGLVPSHLHLPVPARGPDEIPTRAAFWQRHVHALRLRSRAFTRLALVLLVLLVGLVLTGAAYLVHPTLGTLTVFVLWGLGSWWGERDTD